MEILHSLNFTPLLGRQQRLHIQPWLQGLLTGWKLVQGLTHSKAKQAHEPPREADPPAAATAGSGQALRPLQRSPGRPGPPGRRTRPRLGASRTPRQAAAEEGSPPPVLTDILNRQPPPRTAGFSPPRAGSAPRVALSAAAIPLPARSSRSWQRPRHVPRMTALLSNSTSPLSQAVLDWP